MYYKITTIEWEIGKKITVDFIFNIYEYEVLKPKLSNLVCSNIEEKNDEIFIRQEFLTDDDKEVKNNIKNFIKELKEILQKSYDNKRET